MARTLAQIERQIQELQQRAAALKAKEAPGVIQRIKEAIAHYSLTAEHLFGGEAAKATTAKNAKPTSEKGRAKGAGKKVAGKSPGVVRFRDDAGHTWTGRGPQPKWLKDAIASGKTLEDLKVA